MLKYGDTPGELKYGWHAMPSHGTRSAPEVFGMKPELLDQCFTIMGNGEFKYDEKLRWQISVLMIFHVFERIARRLARAPRSASWLAKLSLDHSARPWQLNSGMPLPWGF
jgi:hypothetical protein